jgi:hypothetical protein
LGHLATRCPVCEEKLRREPGSERRTARTVPFVRDWITELRLRGGDFSKEAARDANEFAYQAFRRGLRAEEVFDIARTAYYKILAEEIQRRNDRNLAIPA